MEQPIINTKLFVPRSGLRLVARPHLLERLAEWGDRKLTLVSAPPGFGKTTLISEWIQSMPGQVGWVSLDREDDDPVRFWMLVVQALKSNLGDALARAERMLQAPSPSYQPLVAEILNRLAEHGERMVLVLDDYHAITEPAIHEPMSQLIERMPPNGHLVLVTRADPPLPLGRLRARSMMTELRAADLRFQPGEAERYLNGLMSLGLGEADVTTLARVTEGWVSGLQLAALSLQRAEDRNAFLTTFAGTNRYILDYLIEETLRLQPEHIQRFLLETSIVERFSAPLCDELLATSESQAVLEALEVANLFIVPLDEERRWYRYHHLFADMLRHQLAKQRPEAPGLLLERAARWFDRQGMLAEAILHALAGKHHELAADLIATAQSLLRRGEVARVLGWLVALPEALLDRRPDLLLMQAWILFPTGQHLALESLLRRAEVALVTGFRPTAPERPRLEPQVLALKALTARTKGDFWGTVQLSQQALAALPVDDWMWRSRVAINLAISYQQCDRVQPAQETFELAMASIRDLKDDFHQIVAMALKGAYTMELGRLSSAHALFEESLALAEALGARSSAVASFAWVGLGASHLLKGHEEDAISHLTEGLSCAEGAIEPTVNACRLLGHLFRRRGEHAEAERVWERGIAMTQERHLILFERYLRAHRAVSRHEPSAELEEWIALCGSLGSDHPPHWPLEDRGLLHAQALHVLGRRDAGRELLEQIEARALAAGRIPLALHAMGVRVDTLAGSAEAQAILLRAVSLAESVGCVPPVSARRPSLETEQPSLVEPLSDREREVLMLISEGMTNQEIADRLCIELSTVKRHATNIFGKLGVSNRTLAVARARTFRLV